MLYKVQYSNSDNPNIVLSAIVSIDSDKKTESEILEKAQQYIKKMYMNGYYIPNILIIDIKKYESDFWKIDDFFLDKDIYDML